MNKEGSENMMSVMEVKNQSGLWIKAHHGVKTARVGDLKLVSLKDKIMREWSKGGMT